MLGNATTGHQPVFSYVVEDVSSVIKIPKIVSQDLIYQDD